MDFSLLNKVVGAKKAPSSSEFDIEVFFSKVKGLDNFFNKHLLNDTETLLDAMEEMDSLTTIHSIENNMSLVLMLKEY